MDIQKLIYFNSVVKHLNFTRAAEENFISQTAVSRHIAALEESIGTQLLIRDNRTVILTDAGKVFHKHSVQLVEQYHNLLDEVRETYQNQTPSLKIGFGQYEYVIISKIVGPFIAQYPNIKIKIEQYLYKDLMHKLQADAIDFAFALPSSVECISEDTVYRSICPSNLHLIVSREHPLANAESIKATDIPAGDSLITLSEDHGPCAFERLKRVTSAQGYRIGHMIQANSLDSLILMVESGLGVAFIPEICSNYATPLTVTIPIQGFNTGNFVMLYKKSNKNATLNSFIEFFNKIENITEVFL